MTENDKIAHLTEQVEKLTERVRQLDDIEEIRKLRAIYCSYSDGGWPEHGPTHMGPYDKIYVEDSFWDGRPMAPLSEGREAIQEFMVQMRAIPFIQHYSTNSKIDIADDGKTATGIWHVLAPVTHPDGDSQLIIGTYDEKYVRTPEGWRIKSTRFIPSRVGKQPSGWDEIERE